MSKSCACNGENENCRHCHGSGIVPDRLGAALDEAVRRRIIEDSPSDDIKASPRPSWSLSNTSTTLPPDWAECPKGCGWMNNTREVERHAKNCAGVRVSPPQKMSAALITNPTAQEVNLESAKDSTRQNTIFAAPHDKNLDATKDLGYPAREQQGKYGSYPGCDDFSDESEP
jgi:hypothetical protein